MNGGLVLAGGGHTHVEVLRAFARKRFPMPVTLISPEPRALYTGMLPGVLRGEYRREEAEVDLAALATRAGAALIAGELAALDPAARRMTLADGSVLGFDWLALDIGGVQPAPAAALPVKPIGRFLERWLALEPTLPRDARIAVVGNGAGGTELAIALAQRLHGRARIVLVAPDRVPLPGAPPRARRHAAGALDMAGVERLRGTANSYENGRLGLDGGAAVGADAAIWCTGARGPAVLAGSGLALDDLGCARVDAALRALGQERIFAAGDCAAAGHPKAGVWAVRAGPVLAGNLRRCARGAPPRPWRPQRSALAILGLGHGRALAWRGPLSLAGRLPMRFKVWLDRRWVQR